MGIVCAWYRAVAMFSRLPWCRATRFWKRGAGLLALLGASATPAALVAIAGPSPFGGTPDQISLARYDEREPMVRVLLDQLEDEQPPSPWPC
jgi:hypothetical protein